MELEEEARQLRETVKLVRKQVPQLKAAIAGLFAPKERPRPEVLGAMHLVATAAGVPAKCPDPACRRTGLCKSESAWEAPCQAIWTDEMASCFEHMVIGVMLSAMCADRHNEVIHARLTRLFEISPGAATGRRKKRSA